MKNFLYILRPLQSSCFCGVGFPPNLNPPASLNFLSLAASAPLKRIQIRRASLQNSATLEWTEYMPKIHRGCLSAPVHNHCGFPGSSLAQDWHSPARVARGQGALSLKVNLAELSLPNSVLPSKKDDSRSESVAQ